MPWGIGVAWCFAGPIFLRASVPFLKGLSSTAIPWGVIARPLTSLSPAPKVPRGPWALEGAAPPLTLSASGLNLIGLVWLLMQATQVLPAEATMQNGPSPKRTVRGSSHMDQGLGGHFRRRGKVIFLKQDGFHEEKVLKLLLEEPGP